MEAKAKLMQKKRGVYRIVVAHNVFDRFPQSHQCAYLSGDIYGSMEQVQKDIDRVLKIAEKAVKRKIKVVAVPDPRWSGHSFAIVNGGEGIEVLDEYLEKPKKK